MTRIPLLAASIITLSGCALIMPIEESNLPVRRYADAELAWQVANVVDAFQTLHIADSRRTDDQMAALHNAGVTPNRYCYEEGNPFTRMLIGEHPSKRSVILSSALFAVGHYYVSAWLEKKDTLNEQGQHNSPWYVAAIAWHAVGLVTKGATVVSNHSIGLRVGGSGCTQ